MLGDRLCRDDAIDLKVRGIADFDFRNYIGRHLEFACLARFLTPIGPHVARKTRCTLSNGLDDTALGAQRRAIGS